VSLPPAYFDDVYAGGVDPWGFRDRWYEERKRALTLAALPARDLGRCFEPGCSIGVLTAALAPRCTTLLGTDVSPVALSAARRRLAGQPQVTLERRVLPGEWPAGTFDTVVVSELAYYLVGGDLDLFWRRACGALAPAGTLLACHWRHPVTDYPIGGDEAHDGLGAAATAAGLGRLVHHIEDDLVLEVFSPDPRSVAARGGLA